MISERVTASSHGPLILLLAAQCVQNFSVEASAWSGSTGFDWRHVQGQISEHEGRRFAGRNGEVGDGLEVFAVQQDIRTHQNRVGPGNPAQRLIVEPRDPRHGRAIAETQHQLGVHLHLAALAHHPAHDMRAVDARRHEIDQRRRAVGGFEARFQDQRVGPVAARNTRRLAFRRDKPAPVLVRAQQRGKAGIGIEPRPAQPVDRAVAADQRRCAQIADQGIVFDARGHVASVRW